MSNLNPALYYYCEIGKNPKMGKIRACCVKKFHCRHLKCRPRKNGRKSARSG